MEIAKFKNYPIATINYNYSAYAYQLGLMYQLGA